MLEEMLKRTLNNPVVITKEQLKNIQIFMRETEDGIETITLEDYIITKAIKKLIDAMSKNERGE